MNKIITCASPHGQPVPAEAGTATLDVLVFGAFGYGTTDVRAAFLAADAAADGRAIFVPEGRYFIGSDLAMSHVLQCAGHLVMPDEADLSLSKTFDLDGYASALGSQVMGLKKGLKHLLNQHEFTSFDMCGRYIVLDEPFDLQAIAATKNSFTRRRVLRNGTLAAATSSAWADNVVLREASWAEEAGDQLNDVSNAAAIPVGSLVNARAGVGREIYVRAVNAAQNRIFLNKPLSAAEARQTYTFTAFQYMIDLQGWQNLQHFELEDVTFACGGQASALRLPLRGLDLRIEGCVFDAPKDRAVTSTDEGCQGLQIENCRFSSNEQSQTVPDRSSIGFNINAAEARICNNSADMFLHFGVIHGTGAIISGNRICQGDTVTEGMRSPGLVISKADARIMICSNRVEHCYIEWTNEHDASPEYERGRSFHGMTVQGNTFIATSAARWMRFISVKPMGTGHFIDGLSVTGNVFKKTRGATLFAVEGVDTSIADLDLSRVASIVFAQNTYHGIEKKTENPAGIRASQAKAQTTWLVDFSDHTPFGAPVKYGVSILPDGPVRSITQAPVYTQPWTQGGHGSGGRSLRIGWSQAVSGSAQVTARCDT